MGSKIRQPVIKVIGEVATVELTKGQVALIDAADVPLVSHLHWYAQSAGGRQYAVHAKEGFRVSMHRLILGLSDSSTLADHINGNGLDNRRCNLRRATDQGNSANTRLSSRNKSGYKGVTWHPGRRKWIAAAGNRYLGYFETAESAARAYDRAAIERWGDFARTNASLGLISPQ